MKLFLDVSTLIEGFFLCVSLIAAIGAQNAFVLKQGLKRQYLLMTALTCSISDAFLITLGVTGIGALITESPVLMDIMRWGGAAFLIYYAMKSFWNVFHPHALVAALENPTQQSRKATLFALLGFTFLNPHTYIDTFILLGTVGAEYPEKERWSFIIGTLLASVIWFFSLTFGASKLTPLFKNPRAWQILDSIMGCVMIGIAFKLIF